MSELTYQAENNTGLEYFEWDWTWFDNAPDKDSDRILVIGDSITVGYRTILSKVAGGRYFVDGIATSKGVDNPAFTALIDYVMPQLGNTKVVLINNGLHGWHLSADDYEKHYDALVKHITGKYSDMKFVIVTTTPARSKENIKEFAENYSEILERNKRATKIAEKYGVAVFDAFSVVAGQINLYSPDGVHLKEDGYELIAKELNEFITKLL